MVQPDLGVTLLGVGDREVDNALQLELGDVAVLVHEAGDPLVDLQAHILGEGIHVVRLRLRLLLDSARPLHLLSYYLLLLELLEQLVVGLLGLAELHALLRGLLGDALHLLLGHHLLESVLLGLIGLGGLGAEGVVAPLDLFPLALELVYALGGLVLVVRGGDGLHLVLLEVGVEALLGDLALLDLGVLLHLVLLDHLLLAVDLLVGGVHLDEGLDLGDGHALAVAVGDDVVEAEDEVDRLLDHGLLVHALGLALRHDDLLHEADDLDVLNDVGALGGDEHEEQLLHGLVDVADLLRLNEVALLALTLVDQLREVRHVLLQLQLRDGDELPRQQDFSVLVAHACADYYHFL
uniref:NAD-specific glutamate dehydrogenase n=1 Tax=Strombidium rassoulzadegani TaxID=1082188 RepID=A0A7S3CII1_9SPIT|mmetsp:Transcript_11800/g.19926  ORF Transcript_11800/g.19926 Transcript_11800/m.19926 type:complete len:351 (+) Transcript_11800:665-1717(+)